MQPATNNPYAQTIIPAIGRVWQALQDLGARLQSRTLQISVRSLALEAGLASAGRISQHLRQLEADGRIAYDPLTSIVILITEGIDHTGDRSDPIEATPAPSAETTDHTRDRVNPSYKVHESHDHEGGREARTRATTPALDLDADWPKWEALGVIPEAYPSFREDFPDVTLEQFSQACKIYAARNWKFPAGGVIKRLRQGYPLPVSPSRTHVPQPIVSKTAPAQQAPQVAPGSPPPLEKGWRYA